MSTETIHPGAMAAKHYLEYLASKQKAKQLREGAAEMRKKAKSAELAVDAYKMRIQAKKDSGEAMALTGQANKLKRDIMTSIGEAAKLLMSRMPNEYQNWGVVKTRAYVKTLGIVSAQSKKVRPNMGLATNAINLLLSHATWSEEKIRCLAAITSMPKELPSSQP